MPSPTHAKARHAATLAGELAQVLAEAVALAPTPSLRLHSARVDALAERAKIAAAFAEIARSPVGEAEAAVDAFAFASEAAAQAGIAYREAAGGLDS